ncbi:MAG TPA: phosphoenolpyruvate synthase regulatory protein [Gammaproteobacteria bacterium]|jgi:regulator of PEP synthase PpsR (kinase-PPPase family)|nr:phosphoenolpyruvate synthase regulatory protein [Gammaproteobacteria bacterium]
MWILTAILGLIFIVSARYVFVVSDRTGLTAEALANSLLCQFPSLDIRSETMVFIDNLDKVGRVEEKINGVYAQTGMKPLVFMTVVDDRIRDRIMACQAVFYDFFGTFIEPLEKELSMESSHTVGSSHGVRDPIKYTSRISAVHYSLMTDDGLETDHYNRADIIVIGVSRCGKTPTCLYLSLHYGVYAANYPLTTQELDSKRLPPVLIRHRAKLFGLTIDPFRLLQIRQERYQGDSYSSSSLCQREVAQAESIYRVARIPYINTTRMSIEEIGAKLMQRSGLTRSLL